MSSFFGEICKTLAEMVGKKAIERGIEVLNQSAQENAKAPERYPEKVIEPIPLTEAAGEIANELNLSCKSYRAASMSREEAINEGYYWTLLDDPDTARLHGYRGSSSIVYIPYMIEGLRITEIRFGAFEGNSKLKKVYIPDTVEKIGDCAFCGCDNLDFVRIPNRKIEYPRDCFCRCRKLIKQEIRDAAAEKSRRNLELTMQKYEIDVKSHYEGGVMERVPYDEAVYYVANGLINLGSFDYREKGTEEIVRIPHKIGNITVTEIRNFAFKNNPYVRQVYIPDTVKTICSKAFCNCPNLEYVRIPNDPELVFEEDVFVDCPKLLKPHLREAVVEMLQNNRNMVMSEYALDDRTPYEGGEIERAPYNEAVYYVANGLSNMGCFDYRGKSAEETVYIPRKIGDITVTEIGSFAFDNNPYIRRIYIPDTVMVIRKEAFYNCPNLEYVRIPNNPDLMIEEKAFADCPKLLQPQLREAAEEKNRNNRNTVMSEYMLDDQTPYEGGEIERAPYNEAVYYVANGMINMGCFDYRGKGTEETIYIPRKIGDITVTAIDSHAFAGNPYVRRVYIPDTVRLIYSRAFHNCPNLEYVRIPNNPELVFEEDVFVDCPKLENSEELGVRN